MRVMYTIIKDLFNIFFITWIILLFLEFFNPGMVHRLINLEYYFYCLLLLFLILRIWKK
jgi:hypothetical protein